MRQFLSLAALILAIPALALDFEHRESITSFGAYRDTRLNGPLYPKRHAADAHLWAAADLDFAHALGESTTLKLRARPELRGLYSNMLDSPAPGAITVAGPARLLDMDWRFASGNSAELWWDLERLDLSLSTEYADIFAGRRPVSLGTLRLLTIWDRFNDKLPLGAGPTLVFGRDVLGARAQVGTLAVQIWNMEAQQARGSEAVRLLEVTAYTPWAEIHGLLAQWWGEMVLGLALAADVEGSTMRAEFMHIGAQGGSSQAELQGAFGFEYAFDEQWSLLNEWLLQTQGAGSKSGYGLSTGSRFRTLRGLLYTLVQARYKWTPDVTLDFGGLVNAVDASTLILAQGSFTLSDQLEAFLDLRLPIGPSGAEFSSRVLTVLDGSSIGFPMGAALGLKTVF